LRLSDNSVSYQTALIFSRILAFLTLSTYYNQVKLLKSYENTTLKKLSHNFLSYGTASLELFSPMVTYSAVVTLGNIRFHTGSTNCPGPKLHTP
jgi:hypothetical protein